MGSLEFHVSSWCSCRTEDEPLIADLEKFYSITIKAHTLVVHFMSFSPNSLSTLRGSYGRSNGRVRLGIGVRALAWGFRLRRLAQKFVCQISMFISTAQARAKWASRIFQFRRGRFAGCKGTDTCQKSWQAPCFVDVAKALAGCILLGRGTNAVF